MYEIKSFKIFQTSKVVGVIYAISFAIVVTLQLIAIMVFRGGGQKPPIMLLVIFPIIGSVFSFIVIAFTCWLYNLVAPYIGGIAFELAPRNDN